MRRKGKEERGKGKGLRSSSLTFNLSPFTSLAPNLTAALLAWYDEARRELPWRDHPDPYAVLVSEVMLQQTTVAAVIPHFNRWMERYPTIRDLAEAGEADVLRSWEGLGYYRRARNLHRAAREVVRSYGGELQRDPGSLKRLPGVGDYTAGAVASIAFGLRVPAVDANVFRVLSRLLAVSHENDGSRLKTRGEARRYLTRAVSRMVPTDRPGDFNQAVMDLGASVCTPAIPLAGNVPSPGGAGR